MAWEQALLPVGLEVVIDRLFAATDAACELVRLSPTLALWQLSATVDGVRVFLLGSRDADGAWTRVSLVHT